MIDQFWKLDLAEGDDPSLRKSCTHVEAAGHYCYAVFGGNKEVYSWGMGENYVLGNRDDCNQYTPYLLDPRMFEENPVVMMALGTMHAVGLCKESPEATMPELDSNKFAVVQAMPVSPKKIPVSPKKMPISPKPMPISPVQMPISPVTIPIQKMNGVHQDDVKSQKSTESKKRSRQEYLEVHSQKSE